MTPSELEDRLARHEAAITVMKLLILEMLSDMPKARREAIRNGMRSFSETVASSSEHVLSERVEVTTQHIRSVLAELIAAEDMRMFAGKKRPGLMARLRSASAQFFHPSR